MASQYKEYLVLLYFSVFCQIIPQEPLLNALSKDIYSVHMIRILLIILVATTLWNSSCQDQSRCEYKDSVLIDARPVLIWFGATQTGKSSAIKLLTGNSSILCGQPGRGVSTTSEISLYSEIKSKMSRPYLHIDTIGFADTRLKYQDSDIRAKIEMEILRLSQSEKINKIQAIVLTQSLIADSQQLSKNLAHVKNILGYLPSKSMIILGTKWSQIKREQRIKNREDVIMKIMQQYSIPKDHYLRFSTPYEYLKEGQIDVTQFSKLQEVIGKCKKVQIESIRRKHEQIRKLAEQIRQKSGKILQFESLQDKIKYEIKKEVYTEYIPYNDDKCLLLGYLCYYQTVHIPVQKQRDIKVPYTVQQKVKRNETFYEDAKLSYNQALKQFESKMLEQMINSQ